MACNFMIEYSDFYEDMQCPRNSAMVPANPGVCGNCGEIVFQCHKCRTMNYDEKVPFLCKYAKIEYSLTGRSCCAVDPVESEEGRDKDKDSIINHLDSADKA